MIRPLALLPVLALLALGPSACDEDSPGRFPTNLREAGFEVTSRIPRGRATLEPGLARLAVAIDELPVLAAPGSGPRAFAYQGWLTFVDPDSNRIDVAMGSFRIQETGGPDPIHRTGSVRFTYDRDGTFEVTAGGTRLAPGEPFPDSVALTAEVTFFLAIEPDPDDSPNPGVTHPVVSAGVLPDAAGSVDLIVPANLGLAAAGDFTPILGEVRLSATTGEFRLRFQQLPVLQRSTPPADPGLIYQAWFVDDDLSPPRYQTISRFAPNAIGDVTLSGVVHPGDLDGDGIPEPIDFERLLVSLEPDGLNAQQPVGQGEDTSGEIFPLIPYRVRLPALPAR